MSNQQQIDRLIMTKFSIDDDFNNGLIDAYKYQQLISNIDSAINSLS